MNKIGPKTPGPQLPYRAVVMECRISPVLVHYQEFFNPKGLSGNCWCKLLCGTNVTIQSHGRLGCQWTHNYPEHVDIRWLFIEL